jgi:O-antigen/teichoic acid export membrane protein
MQFSIQKHLKIDGAVSLQIMLLLRQLSLISVSVLLSKCFSINEIGEIESLQFLLTTFSVFWVNGLLQWFLPAYQNTLQQERNAFLQRVFFIFLLLSALLCSSIYFGEVFIFDFFLKKSAPSSTPIFLIYALLFLPTYLLEYVFFVRNKFNKILIFSILSFIIQNGAILFAWYFELGTNGIFLIWGVLATLRFIVLTFEINLEKYGKFAILSGALPLIAYSFFAQWAVTFDGWLVNWYYAGDVSKFAIFRYGAREFPIVLALATGLSAAMSSSIASNFENGINELKIKSLRLFHWLFPLSILLLLSSNIWFPLVFSKAFSESVVVFDIFLLLIISRLLFPQSIAIAKGEQKILLPIAVVELLINVIASTILVQYYGLAGIAFGTWIASLSEKLLIAAWLYHKFRITITSYTALIIYILYSTILMTCFILKYY